MAWSGVFDLDQRLAALEERTSHVQPIAKRVSHLEDQFEQKFRPDAPHRVCARRCGPYHLMFVKRPDTRSIFQLIAD